MSAETRRELMAFVVAIVTAVVLMGTLCLWSVGR